MFYFRRYLLVKLNLSIKKGVNMSTSFEVLELVGTSNDSASEAVKSIVLEANKTKPVSWFEVVEERGRVTQDGKIEFQVKIKIGRKL
ncbi:MAG: dodecin domain-containing protein [Ignavibacteriales bacterium]|nr:MAG: dodecin domain-containing protein [Ignavibacteriales bacterium]